MIMKNIMKYISQIAENDQVFCVFGGGGILFHKIWFCNYEQNPQADLNTGYAFHKPDTLATELWWNSKN